MICRYFFEIAFSCLYCQAIFFQHLHSIKNMEKEVSCINTKAVLEYMDQYISVGINKFLADLHPEIDIIPDPNTFLRDPNNWVSSRVASDLFKRARETLNDRDVPYKIAEYAVKKTSLGYIQRIFIKAFWSSSKGYKNVQKINEKFNRNKKVELVSIGRNRAVIRLHWHPEMHSTKALCQYNMGIYIHMPMIWGSRDVDLKESCCYFDGAPYCEYIITWPARNRIKELLSRLFTKKSVLAETVKEMERDKKLLEKKYDEVNHLNNRLNAKVKQLQAIQETDKAILSVLDLEKLLTVIMKSLSNICSINRAIIMMVNEEKNCLSYLYATGFKENVPEEIKNYSVTLEEKDNILARVVNTGKSEYIPDVKSSTLKKNDLLLIHSNPTSVFAVPLITRSKSIGVIAADSANGRGISAETREVFEIFTPQIAIAIENARLYHKLKEQMKELKRSQDLLSRAEKFAFLGDLAAILAHEIKNPMTAIGTFIQMLPYKFDDEEYRVNFHAIAMEETGRVNDLITELLDLVNARETRFELNNLHELIERMILLVSPKTNIKNIEIIKNFDSNIGDIRMDSEKIKQVILNLLSNALEFTSEHGRIEIITKRMDPKEDKTGVRIEIADDGDGIPDRYIKKIFDPYFTTKQKGRGHSGTGLGLFIVYQNLKDHGGCIEVVSEPGKGARFIIDLPLKVSDTEGIEPTE